MSERGAAPPLKLYIIAGEPSGDARGAELMEAIRQRVPDVLFFGAGGPRMRAHAPPGFFDWAHEAVVGLWDVLKKYRYFRSQFHRILGDIATVAPDAVLFIDYPGFNLRLAKALRHRLPKLLLAHYISPQVWAWNRGRIPEMALTLDLMLCIFPFEQPLYEKSGLHTVFVGHPLIDALSAEKNGKARDPSCVGLFPGSREREIRRNFPVMIAAARLLAVRLPDLHFAAAAASDKLAALMRLQLGAAGCAEDFCSVEVGSAHRLMAVAAAGLVASGTATLEAAFFQLPFALVYKVPWLTWLVGKRLVRVPFLGMPNLLAGKEIVREFLQEAAQPEPIAAHLEQLLQSKALRTEMEREFQTVVESLGRGGAAARAAEALLHELRLSGRPQPA